MADVNDVQGYRQKLSNQLELLEKSDISEADREAIRAFVRHEDVSGSVNTGTIVSHLNRLRLSAERGDTPLTEMDLDGVTNLLFTLKHEHNIADGTLRNYRKALRVFYKWRDEEWAEDIKIGSSPNSSVDPESLLTEDEIDEMLDVAERPRDKAALALLADTGLRIGAIASLRVRDVDVSSKIATVSINENANVKGASGSVPMTWSKGYVANWLDIHPRRDNPDSAFVHKIRMIDPNEDGALTYQYLSRRIREIGERAGMDVSRLKMHNFRKSAISRWIREGLPEQAIKHRAHWVKDSSQFETYSGVTDEEMNEQIAAEYGIIDASEAARPAIKECLHCQSPLRDSARFCPGCGAPLTARAAQTAEEIDDDVIDSVADGLSPGEVGMVLEFREQIKDRPALRSLLLSEES